MAITIRNEALEQRIRTLAQRTGETPTELIARLFRENVEAENKARRIAAMQRLRAEARQIFTEDDRASIREAMDDLYDEDGLPK